MRNTRRIHDIGNIGDYLNITRFSSLQTRWTQSLQIGTPRSQGIQNGYGMFDRANAAKINTFVMLCDLNCDAITLWAILLSLGCGIEI